MRALEEGLSGSFVLVLLRPVGHEGDASLRDLGRGGLVVVGKATLVANSWIQGAVIYRHRAFLLPSRGLIGWLGGRLGYFILGGTRKRWEWEGKGNQEAFAFVARNGVHVYHPFRRTSDCVREMRPSAFFWLAR